MTYPIFLILTIGVFTGIAFLVVLNSLKGASLCSREEEAQEARRLYLGVRYEEEVEPRRREKKPVPERR